MPENRRRNMTLTIRVTPGEKDAILRKAKQADMSLTDYLVTSALSTQIFVAEDLKPAITELKRIGNNLNHPQRSTWEPSGLTISARLLRCRASSMRSLSASEVRVGNCNLHQRS